MCHTRIKMYEIGASDPLSRTLNNLTGAVHQNTSTSVNFSSSLSNNSLPIGSSNNLSFGTSNRPTGKIISLIKKTKRFNVFLVFSHIL